LEKKNHETRFEMCDLSVINIDAARVVIFDESKFGILKKIRLSLACVSLFVLCDSVSSIIMVDDPLR